MPIGVLFTGVQCSWEVIHTGHSLSAIFWWNLYYIFNNIRLSCKTGTWGHGMSLSLFSPYLLAGWKLLMAVKSDQCFTGSGHLAQELSASKGMKCWDIYGWFSSSSLITKYQLSQFYKVQGTYTWFIEIVIYNNIHKINKIEDQSHPRPSQGLARVLGNVSVSSAGLLSYALNMVSTAKQIERV